MYLDCTCVNISTETWEKLMAGFKKINYETLIKKIKKELPELFEALDLQYHNPFGEQSGQTKEHYILVHSAIEYFIKK